MPNAEAKIQDSILIISVYLSGFCILCFILSIISGCASTNQPRLITSIQEKASPRLIGANYLFSINGELSRPAGIDIDANGNLYVANSGKNIVYVLDREGRKLESIGRFGWRKGEFDKPSDVAIDAQLRLYIADTGNNRLQRFSLVNQDFSVIAGKDPDLSEKPVIPSAPSGVATDARGYIYLSDTWNHRVLKMDALGRLQMEIGGLGQLNKPQGIAVDPKNNIYVCDTGNNRICIYDFSGIRICSFGKEGSGNGQFLNPTGISLDKFGNIYVVDQGNKRIQVFGSNRDYLMDFGSQYLNEPVDIVIDGDLRIYVTDMSASDIKVFKIITGEETSKKVSE